MTPAGKRDTRVHIQRLGTERNSWNEEVGSWVTLASPLARISYGRADERRTAASEQGVQVATFVMLATSVTRSLVARDRLLAKGRTWDVTSVVPRGRTEVEITATSPDATS